MYLIAEDRGEMKPMVSNCPADEVDMIVVTNTSKILGLGDFGVQVIGIAIGKLNLYIAAAGINPERLYFGSFHNCIHINFRIILQEQHGKTYQ